MSNKDKPLFDALYTSHINEIILTRFRIIALIAIILHLSFYIIDRVSYPFHASAFLAIRSFDSTVILLLFLLSYHKRFKSNGVHLLYGVASTIILGMSLMIFLSDGSHSRYYEGANLVFLGVGVVNSFYIRTNIIFLILWITCIESAMLFDRQTFNLINFCYANSFMFNTAFLVILMNKLYRNQHYTAFVQQQQLLISEEKLSSLYNQADVLSKTDELTSIHNRRHFFAILKKTMDSCELTKNSFYLIIFDVDYFKEINDTYGHAFGDMVLIQIVSIVKKNIRSNDFIGRYGGDEFIICLGINNHTTLLNRLNRISDQIRSLEISHKETRVPVSVSIGAAPFIPGQHMNEKKLMELADEQLLDVKRNARGQIRIAN